MLWRQLQKNGNGFYKCLKAQTPRQWNPQNFFSSLQESKALLSFLHHSTLHLSRNQVNQLNERLLFCIPKVGQHSVSPVLHGVLHMHVSHEDFCCKSSQHQAESRILHHEDNHKILSVTKCTRPVDWDLTVAYVLPAKAKTSVSARQACCEYRRHVNYLTKILASKSAFL